MILLLDVGNSRLKWAWLPCDARQPTQSTDGLEVLAMPVADVLQGRGDALANRTLSASLVSGVDSQGAQAGTPCTIPRPCLVLGSNVADAAVAHALENICLARWNRRIRWCSAADGQHLMQNQYLPPEQLGADRWLAMLGLLSHLHRSRHPRPDSACVLASFGTATTIDTLTVQAPGSKPAACFEGGLIVPGVAMMATSLSSGTARLPLTQIGCSSANLPTSTSQAIACGILRAQAGALAVQYLAMRQEHEAVGLYVSGGAWPKLREAVQQTLQLCLGNSPAGGNNPPPVHWLDTPVLHGLAYLARNGIEPLER